MIDLACLSLGGVDVPLYLTSPPDDLAYVLNDAGASVLAVAGDDQRQKIAQIASEVPSLEQVIHLDTDSAPDIGLPSRLTTLSLTDLLASGEHGTEPAQPVPDPRFGNHHLHLGHDRPTQRRHAEPYQYAGQRRGCGCGPTAE